MILRVVSKIHKIFDEVVTTADMVRSQIMNFWNRLLYTLTPVHHCHNYIAMSAAYNRKNKRWMIFDSDLFNVGIDSMTSAYKSP